MIWVPAGRGGTVPVQLAQKSRTDPARPTHASQQQQRSRGVEKTQGYARQFRRGLLRNSSQIVAQPAAVTTSKCGLSRLHPAAFAGGSCPAALLPPRERRCRRRHP